jgi:hypothetical protein
MNSLIQNINPLPTFHDAKLSGVVLSLNKQCTLLITDENGEFHRIVLVGVERLRANDFLEGNIILDVTAQTGEGVQKADVFFALSIDDEKRHPVFFDAIMERIRQRDLILVQINPSYGCTFSCLCSGWFLDPPTGATGATT